MRFSKKQYPILDHLGSARALFKFQEDGFTESVLARERGKELLKDIAGYCDLITMSKTIDFVSVPFFEKATKGNVFDKLTGLFSNLDQCDGILLYPKNRFSKIHAISYAVFPHKRKKEVVAELHLYSEVGRVVILYLETDKDLINWKSVLSTSIRFDSKGNTIESQAITDWITNHMQTMFAILTFKQFAEVEVNEIGGVAYPKRVKIGKEKYLNESDLQINVLDSKWFTETIRSEGFAVSGHFRLQPYGPGMSKRKLIYIDDFLKTGYTRKARIDESINN